MTLRVFTDRTGAEWNVWLVHPSQASDQLLQERYRAGWLCFERADGAERYRLPMSDVPSPLESIPDEELEPLCRIAQLATETPRSKPAAPPSTRTSLENMAKARGAAPLKPGDA